MSYRFEGYWILRSGRIYRLTKDDFSHGDVVIWNPEWFGISKSEVEKMRAEIRKTMPDEDDWELGQRLRDRAVEKGAIVVRIRANSLDKWSIYLQDMRGRLGDRQKDFLRAWGKKALSDGTARPGDGVIIQGSNLLNHPPLNVEDLAMDKLYSVMESRGNRIRRLITAVSGPAVP